MAAVQEGAAELEGGPYSPLGKDYRKAEEEREGEVGIPDHSPRSSQVPKAGESHASEELEQSEPEQREPTPYPDERSFQYADIYEQMMLTGLGPACPTREPPLGAAGDWPPHISTKEEAAGRDTPAEKELSESTERVWVHRACAGAPRDTGTGVSQAGPGQEDRPSQGNRPHQVRSGPSQDSPPRERLASSPQGLSLFPERFRPGLRTRPMPGAFCFLIKLHIFPHSGCVDLQCQQQHRRREPELLDIFLG